MLVTPPDRTHTDYQNPVQVKRAYKFRAYPTSPQEGRSVRLLRDHCDLYNAALEERREAWRMRKVSISFSDQSRQLTHIRRADPEGQGRHSSVAQLYTLRRLSDAFQAFYKRTQKGAGYPRFKPYSRFTAVMFPDGSGAKWKAAGTRWTTAGKDRWARAYFMGVGMIKVQQHRTVIGTVKTLQLKREGRRWYVVIVSEAESVPMPPAGRDIGVDLGIARFLTTSDGEVVPNPRLGAASDERIADLRRGMASAKRGSGNRKRLRRQFAKECRKVRNRRRDFHHKTARALVNTCDMIALEKLNIDGMTRKPAPKPDPEQAGAFLPNQAAAKAGLSKLILDAGWAQFVSILTGKAEEAGRSVILVNPAYTSIDCHICGARCTRPQQDTVVCPVHGKIDADVNGARNIASRAGLGSGQVAQAA